MNRKIEIQAGIALNTTTGVGNWKEKCGGSYNNLAEILTVSDRE